jgi:hypothetical protein
MFTITNKIRTIIAASAVAAALASGGVASAAMLVHRPGTITTKVAPPIVTAPAPVIDPHKVGSAGIAGYDDEACQQLANDVNSTFKGANYAAGQGDSATASDLYDKAQGLDAELEANCMVMD